jgi:hypothetical protein
MRTKFLLSAFLVLSQSAIAGNLCGPIQLSQNTSINVTPATSISCNSGTPNFFHRENSYYRAFSLASYPNGFNVCGVRFGVQNADAGGTSTSQPLSIRVYANTGAAFPAGTRTLVGSVDGTITDGTNMIVETPITATIPAGTNQLVAEIFTPDGAPASNQFFLGANAAGQSGPSYIRAPSCNDSTPISLSAIFPNVHYVLTVVGDAANADQIYRNGFE